MWKKLQPNKTKEITIKVLPEETGRFLFYHKSSQGKVDSGYEVVTEKEFNWDTETVVLNLITKLNLNPDIVIAAANTMKERE